MNKKRSENDGKIMTAVRNYERLFILNQYEKSGRNQRETALALGVSRKTIRERLTEYGIIVDGKRTDTLRRKE